MRIMLLLLVFAQYGYAQTAAQQKALNNYADFANQSADEVAAVVKSVIQYYPSAHQKSSFGAPRYSCPMHPEDYYLKTALAESKSLPVALADGLTKRLKEMEAGAEKIDEKCKALDTYHKLEDYKKDNFARATEIINELQSAIRRYRATQDALSVEMENALNKLNPAIGQTPYGKADAMLKKQIAREREFLDTWTFNLIEAVPTGWPVDKLEKSIAETAQALDMIKKQQPALKYPTSGMWSNFQESLSGVLEAKRNALDQYNNEAKKSDRHGNDAYLRFINYFNGTLVSDQNNFIQYASNDGYRGLKSIKYFPLFEIRSQAVAQVVSIKPFTDYPRTPLNPPMQKAAPSRSAYGAFVNYIEYINETGHEIDYLAQVLHNLSSRAAGYKPTDSHQRQGSIFFDYKDFQLPLSRYQKTVSESSLLSPVFAKSLNQQAEVLLNILKELDAISATLEAETTERKYESDHVAHVYELLERTKVLIQTWDDRKELLYTDVRKVFDSYPAAQPASSWYVSGKALQHLTDLDHDALFQAREFYRGGQVGATTLIDTDPIDVALRDVIGKEYQNMKGIEKYGRYNGLCPYSPYEDLPEASKKLSEKLNPLATGKGSAYDHPYYRVLYQYNDVVRHYNTFCELSKTAFLLPTVRQPQLFELRYPDNNGTAGRNPAPGHQVVRQGTVPSGVSTSEAAQTGAAVAVTKSSTSGSGNATPGVQDVSQSRAAPASQQTNTIHSVQHDTVYIERRDTVYLSDSNESLRSMEGYATNNMILLLDVSGSMNAPDKLPVLKSSVLELISMMRPEDKVSIISFSDKPKALLIATSFKDEARIRQAINALKSSGKTDGNAGVKLAYRIADENYLRGGNNRIILATDGEFVLHDDTRELIRKFSNEDIYLSIFNFGKGAGASRALEQVAHLGKGNYQYISKENVELQLIREVKAKRAR